MKEASFQRTVRTVRHLRPSQVLWRMRYRARRQRPAASVAMPAHVAPRNDWPIVPVVHTADADADEAFVTALERGRFAHLEQTLDLGHPRPDWMLGPRSSNRLWIVTLHYHGWALRLAQLAANGGALSRRACALLRHYLADWIERCPADGEGARDLAWNSYAIATRLGSWTRLYHTLGAEGRKAWNGLAPAFIESLWQQAAYLHGHIEWDLRGNHLLRDAVGLAWAGRFFDGPEPRRWLDTAGRLAVAQVREQVLADGAHFERSPMYHLHVMEDVLCLALLLEDKAARARMREVWQRMAEFLAWVRCPDGQVPLLNDAALNGAAEPATVLRMGAQAMDLTIDERPRSGGQFFPDAGLAVWHGQPWSLFFDIGHVGPDYQPGHAHADTLTICCSFEGRRLIVDPGVFAYDNDEVRRYVRSTAAHNTVTIDGRDSSEVWHMFRVGHRARPRDVDVQWNCRWMQATGSHDGYRVLPGKPSHTRTVQVEEYGLVRIDDEIDGEGRHDVRGSLLLDPAWRVVARDDDGWRVACDGRAVRIAVSSEQGVRLTDEPAAYHPRFGERLETTRLTWSVQGDLPARVQTSMEAVAVEAGGTA